MAHEDRKKALLKKHGFNNTIDVSDVFEGVVKNKSVEIIN